jgi:DNA modification methylase
MKNLLDLKNMDSIYRIPNKANWPEEFINSIFESDALEFLKKLPNECIALIVTSPPYWNVKDYENSKQIGQTSYDQYLADLLKIWQESERILIPNGKLAIVTPIMPISKEIYNESHTRHLKNINNDIEYTILNNTKLQRYSLFIWQKQTSEKMFGSYPYPPNIYEDNTIEFINVLVKAGKPTKIPKNAKEPSKITQAEWLDLTKQIWPIYPADVKRAGHPAPFPIVLPQRLIMMYTFKSAYEADFDGDIVLDMFNGSGSTCIATKALERNYIGIDLNPDYCQIAMNRLNSINQDYGENVDPNCIMLESTRVKRPQNSRQSTFL